MHDDHELLLRDLCISTTISTTVTAMTTDVEHNELPAKAERPPAAHEGSTHVTCGGAHDGYAPSAMIL